MHVSVSGMTTGGVRDVPVIVSGEEINELASQPPC